MTSEKQNVFEGLAVSVTARLTTMATFYMYQLQYTREMYQVTLYTSGFPVRLLLTGISIQQADPRLPMFIKHKLSWHPNADDTVQKFEVKKVKLPHFGQPSKLFFFPVDQVIDFSGNPISEGCCAPSLSRPIDIVFFAMHSCHMGKDRDEPHSSIPNGDTGK